MGSVAGWAVIALATHGCTSGEKEISTAPRGVASEKSPVTGSAGSAQSVDNEPVSIKYYTYEKGLATSVDVITPERWASFRDGGRTSFLSKFYFANVNTKSNRGKGHVVCFTGSAQAVRDQYMNPERAEHTVANLAEGARVPQTAASENGMVLGVRFKVDRTKAASKKGAAPAKQDPEFYFRMSQCTADKGGIGVGGALKNEVSKLDAPEWPEMANARRAPANAASVGEQGFVIEDQPQNGDEKKVPVRFKLIGDYERMKIRENDRPWKGMDISTAEGAYQFALLVQKYTYEGMFENASDARRDLNLRAENNKVRDWCHMPWQATGPKGREWVHGMTKEFDLKPSPTMDLYKGTYPGSNWGVAYYNSFACKTLEDVFGPSTARKAAPDFSKAELFNDGSVIVKFLFTYAKVPGTEGAFKWTSNVSGPGSNVRALDEVRHVQMDVSVRDTTLKGTDPETANWVMITYYFDPAYDAEADAMKSIGKRHPVLDVKNLPAGLKKMRPMGIVTNFEAPKLAAGPDSRLASHTGHSIVFKGAQSNEIEYRLNGPVDNPESSCLGCHATAGTRMKSVPGVQNLATWAQIKSEAKLDFNQQMRKAKENFETFIAPAAAPAK
jgi:hypothetical protein